MPRSSWPRARTVGMTISGANGSEATTTRRLVPLSKGDRHAQEGRRDGGGVFASVLALEEDLELLLQVGSSTVLFRGFERIHGRPVVFSEFTHECRRCAAEVEGERVPREGDLLRRNSGCGKALRHITLNAPGHGAD